MSSKSNKTIDTLSRLDTENGTIEEVQLRTLAKNSASKLPELREDFAWFTTTVAVGGGVNESMLSGSNEGGNNNSAPVMREESKRGSISSSQYDTSVATEASLSFFMHGGSITNAKTKKKKYLNDFYHLDVAQGLFRKFFLFDAAKGRARHSMARVQNEVFLFGGEGLNGTVFDDLWRFDMENVQWSE